MPARAELAELGDVAAVLLHAGAAVTAVVVGVHGVAGREQILGESMPSAGVLAEAVHELDDAPSAGRRPLV